jgi:hypothetical protein
VRVASPDRDAVVVTADGDEEEVENDADETDEDEDEDDEDDDERDEGIHDGEVDDEIVLATDGA